MAAAPADYIVVTKDSVEELIKEVKKEAAAGFKPVGGVVVDHDSTAYPQEDGSYEKTIYHQALFKEAVTE